jgi:hypothetical protein
MANIITAGNSTNGGTAISTDTSGTLNIVTGSGSGTNAITIDASQNVTATGNLTVTGALTVSGGVSGSITRGTNVAASGTSVTFTGIPSTVKRITVMFNQVSTTGTSPYLIQLGTSGGVEATGYAGSAIALQGSAASSAANTSSIGFFVAVALNVAADIYSGNVVLTNIDGNNWVQSGVVGNTAASRITNSTGIKQTAAVLDRIRITTVNGTDTFDLGAINILYE